MRRVRLFVANGQPDTAICLAAPGVRGSVDQRTRVGDLPSGQTGMGPAISGSIAVMLRSVLRAPRCPMEIGDERRGLDCQPVILAEGFFEDRIALKQE